MPGAAVPVLKLVYLPALLIFHIAISQDCQGRLLIVGISAVSTVLYVAGSVYSPHAERFHSSLSVSAVVSYSVTFYRMQYSHSETSTDCGRAYDVLWH